MSVERASASLINNDSHTALTSKNLFTKRKRSTLIDNKGKYSVAQIMYHQIDSHSHGQFVLY